MFSISVMWQKSVACSHEARDGFAEQKIAFVDTEGRLLRKIDPYTWWFHLGQVDLIVCRWARASKIWKMHEIWGTSSENRAIALENKWSAKCSRLFQVVEHQFNYPSKSGAEQRPPSAPEFVIFMQMTTDYVINSHAQNNGSYGNGFGSQSG